MWHTPKQLLCLRESAIMEREASADVECARRAPGSLAAKWGYHHFGSFYGIIYIYMLHALNNLNKPEMFKYKHFPMRQSKNHIWSATETKCPIKPV